MSRWHRAPGGACRRSAKRASIAEYLAEKYRARLVLVGRSATPRADAIRRIEQLGGEVQYASANVSDASALRRIVEEAHRRFGALHGVIHGAGIVGDGGYREIKDSERDSCDVHFQAKAHGLLALESALQGRTPDFCLLLSSLASVLGGIGQAAYAASNIFMDSFARMRCRSAPMRWLSVNWDVWRLQEDAAAGPGPGATLRELGMSGPEASAMMETVLALRGASQLVVSTGDLGARIDQWVRLESLEARGASPAGAARTTPAPRPSLQTAFDAPRNETERQVARIWQEALGIDAVGIHDGFAELGGHSLLAVRIVVEMRKAFQIDLPVRALFDAPTVAELSRYLQTRAGAEIAADEEARKLALNA